MPELTHSSSHAIPWTHATRFDDGVIGLTVRADRLTVYTHRSDLPDTPTVTTTATLFELPDPYGAQGERVYSLQPPTGDACDMVDIDLNAQPDFTVWMDDRSMRSLAATLADLVAQLDAPLDELAAQFAADPEPDVAEVPCDHPCDELRARCTLAVDCNGRTWSPGEVEPQGD